MKKMINVYSVVSNYFVKKQQHTNIKVTKNIIKLVFICKTPPRVRMIFYLLIIFKEILRKITSTLCRNKTSSKNPINKRWKFFLYSMVSLLTC